MLTYEIASLTDQKIGKYIGNIILNLSRSQFQCVGKRLSPTPTSNASDHHLTQFHHSLPGDSTVSHRWGAQAHKTAPLHFRCQFQAQVVTYASA